MEDLRRDFTVFLKGEGIFPSLVTKKYFYVNLE